MRAADDRQTDRQTDYCWHMQLPAELVLPAISVCIDLTAHGVTILSRSIFTISLHRNTWSVENDKLIMINYETRVVTYSSSLRLVDSSLSTLAFKSPGDLLAQNKQLMDIQMQGSKPWETAGLVCSISAIVNTTVMRVQPEKLRIMLLWNLLS
jgi:hypothetical protein